MSEITSQPSMPPFRQGEVGALGLRVISGRILEEPRRNLQFPESIKTFQIMMRDPSVAASINVIKMFVQTVDWQFKAPKGKENDPLIKQRVEFFNSLMGDMEESWEDFISSILSMCIYGFSINEKVYKVRNGRKGKYKSRYNDGLIGWAKLPTRSQTTVDKWYFDEDCRNIIGFKQNLKSVNYLADADVTKLERTIPRSKFMLFKYDDSCGNPEGRSPLINAYVPWRYKVQLEEFEAMGVSRDLVGMPKIGLPPDYLAEDADEDKKMFLEYCKTIINDQIANNRAGLIVPRFIDPETKEDIFEFSLVSRQGAKAYDTAEIIERYSKQIMMAFMSDILSMGQSKYGSHSLADNKTSILAMSCATILRHIRSVINRDLVAQTYALNMWDDEDHVEIDFSDIETPDLEVVSKFIQQTVAVGAIEVDKPMSNYLRSLLGLEPADESQKISEDLSPQTQSKAGEGYKTAGEGTAKSPSAINTSTANKANK